MRVQETTQVVTKGLLPRKKQTKAGKAERWFWSRLPLTGRGRGQKVQLKRHQKERLQVRKRVTKRQVPSENNKIGQFQYAWCWMAL